MPLTPGVVGSWAREPGDACSARYPDGLEFMEGTYLGARGPGQSFVVWDAGIYRHSGADRLMVQTASDELVDYRCVVSDDHLSIVADDGCEVRYRRTLDPSGSGAHSHASHPDDAIPDDAIPDDAIPDDAIPDDTIPDDQEQR